MLSFVRPFMPGDVLPPPPSCPPPTSIPLPINPQFPAKSKYTERPPKSGKPFRNESEGPVPQNRTKEEKKNVLWLKNLPKHYNTIEALAGFFKKYGQIRDVYPNPDKNVASIVFFK